MKNLQRPKCLTTGIVGEQKGLKPGRLKLSLNAWSQKPPLPKGETIETKELSGKTVALAIKEKRCQGSS